MLLRMPSTYRIPRPLVSRLQRESWKAGINELCYLVFGKGATISRLVGVPNRADDPVLHHVFGSGDFERVRSRRSLNGLYFLGFLHTHPVPPVSPGKGDIEGYRKGTLIFIYSQVEHSLGAFRLLGGREGYLTKHVVMFPPPRRENDDLRLKPPVFFVKGQTLEYRPLQIRPSSGRRVVRPLGTGGHFLEVGWR